MSEPKTLIVKYLPRGERSHTRALLETFRPAAGVAAEELDLVVDRPPVFLPDSLDAYVARNYLGQALTPAQAKAMAGMDRLTAQLKRAEIVVLATPMHNFSLPAPVKAWFDSVLLKGETWDVGPDGYKGLLAGRKALILMASGGRYEGPMAGWDHGMSLARQLFGFMGFSDIRPAWAAGVNNPALGSPEAIVGAAQDQVRSAVRDWYGR